MSGFTASNMKPPTAEELRRIMADPAKGQSSLAYLLVVPPGYAMDTLLPMKPNLLFEESGDNPIQFRHRFDYGIPVIRMPRFLTAGADLPAPVKSKPVDWSVMRAAAAAEEPKPSVWWQNLVIVAAVLLLLCMGSSAMAQSPAVSIDVDASAQLAIEDEAPVLPDDFAKNDPPRVSANWLPADPAESIPAKNVRRERSRSELSQWVIENYKPSTSLSTDVSPRSNVWNHLIQDHGFLSHQVNGLPQWQALALHDAAHSGKIGPFEESSPAASSSPAETGNGSGITLFTADESWRCSACEQQNQALRDSPVSFQFKTVKGPKEGESPSGLYPCWQGADGAILTGFVSPKALEQWAKQHGKKAAQDVTKEEPQSSQVKPIASVQIESSSASAVLAALADHVARSSGPESLRLSGRSWLPEIDVDLDDPFLRVLDGLLSAEGFELGGAKISWPAGKRAISFDPPIDASYRKVLEVAAQVKSVEVNNREVILRLNGRLIPDLKVILK